MQGIVGEQECRRAHGRPPGLLAPAESLDRAGANHAGQPPGRRLGPQAGTFLGKAARRVREKPPGLQGNIQLNSSTELREKEPKASL